MTRRSSLLQIERKGQETQNLHREELPVSVLKVIGDKDFIGENIAPQKASRPCFNIFISL
jgi:hypothetical protein